MTFMVRETPRVFGQDKNMENKKVTIVPPNANIRLHWNDSPENFSVEGKKRIKTSLQKDYGVDRKAVNIQERATKIDDDGNRIHITGANIDTLINTTHQEGLFKEWIARKKTDIKFDELMKLDAKVNAAINYSEENEKRHRKWRLKWLTMDNFLSYGEDNIVMFDALGGFNIVTSLPENQGGKTTFTVDAIMFLCFGITTKTDTNKEIFNTYSEKNHVKVRGLIEIDNREFIIERLMTRKPKRNGEWDITNSVDYFELLHDGTEKPLIGESGVDTTKTIKETIGTVEDFYVTILATSKNLDSLISDTATTTGKLLTKFIGLEVFENKESAARKMYNAFAKTMKSNHHDLTELGDQIKEHEETVKYIKETNTEEGNKLVIVKDVIEVLNIKRDTALESKKAVDATITALNPSKLETEIEAIKVKGKAKKAELTKINEEITLLSKVNFDEDNYTAAVKEEKEISIRKSTNENEVARLFKKSLDLKNSETCSECNRPLDNVNHTDHIKKIADEHDELIKQVDKDKEFLKYLTKEIELHNKVKESVDHKDSLELKASKLDVDLESLRNTLKDKTADLKSYQANIDAIKFNEEVSINVTNIKTQIQVKETEKVKLIQVIQKGEGDIKQNNFDILTKKDLIETINIEIGKEKIFKLYIEMLGKKGICKLVLRSVLPVINEELNRLLDDICDFTIELNINDKNEVEKLIIKDGVTKKLKSTSGLESTIASLGLRCVLGRLSSLPKPNFIIFDEILGAVAGVNLDSLKLMLDKIKDMFEIVFFITHNEIAKDWGDKLITVRKDNNISKLVIK